MTEWQSKINASVEKGFLFFVITGTCIYLLIASLFYLINLDSILKYKAVQNLCQPFDYSEKESISKYKLWNDYLVFDLFIPDVIETISVEPKCGKD